MDSIRMSAPCLFGIEGVLADELRRMGASEVTPDTGKVLFSGDEAMLARANLSSRFAERIQVQLGEFPARTFEELFEGVKALPWESKITKIKRPLSIMTHGAERSNQLMRMEAFQPAQLLGHLLPRMH